MSALCSAPAGRAGGAEGGGGGVHLNGGLSGRNELPSEGVVGLLVALRHDRHGWPVQNSIPARAGTHPSGAAAAIVPAAAEQRLCSLEGDAGSRILAYFPVERLSYHEIYPAGGRHVY